MIKNKPESWSKYPVRWSKLLSIFWFLLLIVAYLIFLKRQYVDIIFESQFLHIDFLRDISQNQFTAKGFFTVFGEHLFPGYNIVFAANYYLFGLWGGFDSIVYVVCLLISSVFVVGAIYRSSIQKIVIKTLIALTSSFLLLSTTNNPQWGMALAAAIGVTLFVISVFNLEAALANNSKQLHPLTYISLAIAIIFFLGGYAIGAIAAIFLLLIVWVVHNRKIDFKIVSISVVVFASLIIYIVLVSRYGALPVNKPTDATINLKLIGQFVLLMTGASLLGKAFFELTQQFWPYYLCGTILLFWSACLFKYFIQKPAKGRIFVLTLATYSIVNIFVVSIFRFRNGLDGAMGQWYNVHTHFVTVAVCFYLFSSLGERKYSVGSIVKILSIGVIFSAAVAGYYCDWKKSEYIRSWKEQFVAQVPILLAFPDLITDKKNLFNTMLWNYSEAKAGVDFLYSKDLWIFQKNTPLTFGLSGDGWMDANRSVMIVCPHGSKSLRFHAWRPDGWQQSIVSARYAGRRDMVAIKNGDIQFAFTEGKPAVLLDANDLGKSNPVVSNGDARKLVAVINEISCDGPPVGYQNNSSTASPSIELKVSNWGPQSAIFGKNPNKQPDGSMGIWIDVSGMQGLGEAQVLFAGQPAKSTSIQEKLITAAITTDQLAVVGEKEIVIQQIGSGKQFPVGIFKIIGR